MSHASSGMNYICQLPLLAKLYRKCTEDTATVRPISCLHRFMCTGRNRAPTAAAESVWPDGVRLHLQEVTEHIKKKEKERERQLMTSSRKYFGMPPAILQRWPRACQTPCSRLSQRCWDCSPAPLTTLAPCPGLTLRF